MAVVDEQVLTSAMNVYERVFFVISFLLWLHSLAILKIVSGAH
jgi:hypothetical protein